MATSERVRKPKQASKPKAGKSLALVKPAPVDPRRQRAAAFRDAAGQLVAGAAWRDLPLPEECDASTGQAIDVADFMAVMFSRPSGPNAAERAALARMAKTLGPALEGEHCNRVARALLIVEDHAERLRAARKGDGAQAIAEVMLTELGNVDARFGAAGAPGAEEIVGWLSRYDAKPRRAGSRGGLMGAARIVAEIAVRTGAFDGGADVAAVTHKLALAAKRAAENR